MIHLHGEDLRPLCGYRVRYQFLGARSDGWAFRLSLESRTRLAVLGDGVNEAREWVVPWATLTRSERMGVLDDLLVHRRLAEERQLLRQFARSTHEARRRSRRRV